MRLRGEAIQSRPPGDKGEFAVRKVEAGDLLEIQRIEQASFIDPYSSSVMRVLAASNRETFFVAEESGVIVGFIVAALTGAHTGNIVSVAVHPSRRGRRVGSLLLEEELKTLKKLGVKFVRLEVRKGNTSAINLYKRAGFRKSHEIGGYYEDGADAEVFTLDLS